MGMAAFFYWQVFACFVTCAIPENYIYADPSFTCRYT
jgi:hypothetical protein